MDLMLLQVETFPTYAQWGVAGALIMLIGIILGFLLRALPIWRAVKTDEKDVKLAEIAVREKEAEARSAQAASFGQLSGALSSISEVLNNVTVKQKDAIDKVILLTRFNAKETATRDEKLDIVIEHIDGLTQRVESVEHAIRKRNEHGPQAKNTTPTS